MKASCMLTLEFKDAETAKKVHRSIKIDDSGFVKSRVKGATLEASIESGSVASLLHTLDDYLACVSVAYDIVNKH
jgi:tRNA threonylcarbamoyladenosine modification (KEOPS) complex  Pcc1 subunit